MQNIHYHLDYIAYLAERRNWLAGDDFSMADISAGAHLSAIDYLGDVPWDEHPEAPGCGTRESNQRPAVSGPCSPMPSLATRRRPITPIWISEFIPDDASRPLPRRLPAAVAGIAGLGAGSAARDGSGGTRPDGRGLGRHGNRTRDGLADAAATGTDAGTQRADLLKAIDGLAPDVEWRIVSFDRSTDQAGLERWRAVAKARLAENALGGLAEKARQASRPGLQLRISSIEFTPTLGETEAVRARLRDEIYGKADLGAESAGAEFPRPEVPYGRSRLRRSAAHALCPKDPRGRAADGDGGSSEGPVNVSEKLVMRARVAILSAVAPRE